MVPAIVLRVYLIVLGLLLIGISLRSLARRKLTDNFTVIWAILGFLIFLSGFIVKATEVSRFMGTATLVLILIVVTLVIGSIFVLSLCFSELSRKNHELSMQVSLLNQENERIIHEMTDLRKKVDDSKKA